MKIDFDKVTSKADRILLAYGLSKGSWKAGKAIYDKYKERTLYSITIGAGDDIYEDLHAWILESIPEKEKHVLNAETVQKKRYYDPSDKEDDKDSSPITLLYGGGRPQTIILKGYKIRVAIYSKMPEGIKINDIPTDMRSHFEMMTFSFHSINARQALLDHIEKLIEIKKEKKRKPVLRTYANWGEWTTRSDLPPRHLNSVILKEGQLESIIEDISDFLNSEEEYNRLSLSWHRGYLFHGSAGTGKSSLVKLLAHKFNMPIYWISLGDLKGDSALYQAFAAVRSRSILLLEDIDVFGAAADREDKDAKDNSFVTLSGMLNALDGIHTPHGLITMMTTNHPEKLDPALIRSGRIDRMEELSNPDFPQFKNIALWVYNKDIDQDTEKLIKYIEERWDDKYADIPPSKLVDVFWRNRNSPKEGILTIIDEAERKDIPS